MAEEIKDDFGRVLADGDQVRLIFPNNQEHSSRVFELSGEPSWSQLSVAMNGVFPGESKPSTVLVSIEKLKTEIPGLKIHSTGPSEEVSTNV